MKTAKSRRTPKVDEKRLLAYVAAAGAALIAAGPADASVKHGTFNISMSGNERITVEMGASGPSIDFVHYRGTNSNNGWALQASKLLTASFIGVNSSGFKLVNFPKSSPIRVPDGASIYNQGALFQADRTGKVHGYFLPPSGGYFGITFDPGDGLHFGWINVDSVAADYTSYHVNDWGYQDTPNTTILAGETGTTAVPEPASCALALIAMGAGGLAVMRRRKLEKREREAA